MTFQRATRLSLITLCLASLAASSATARGAALERKVWIIGIDGLRPDALAVASTPNIDSLIANGCYSDEAQVGPNTVSGPGWSNMLTGVWSDKHGVVDNGFGASNFASYPNLMERVEAGLVYVETATQLTWGPLFTDLVTGADHTFYQAYSNGGDAAGALDAIDRFTHHDPDLMLTYFADVDIAGHTWGFSPSVPEYLAEIAQVDGQIGAILAALRARPSYGAEDWLILLSSDHGGIGTGHGGGAPEQRSVPYLASGPSAKKGELLPVPNVVDIAVTAMTHLGLAIDPAWKLDGVASGIEARTHLGSNLIVNGDAEYSSAGAGFTPDRGISGWKDIGALTTIAYDSGAGFPESVDPGPASRGSNFFSGGAGTANDACSQLISVADMAHWIDLGVVEFGLSGWLGGFAEQDDRMQLEAVFLAANGAALGGSTIGPVTAADRLAAIGGSGEELTGFLERVSSGGLPAGTRSVELNLLALHSSGGGTDGYADNLSFVLRLDPVFDCNVNGTPDILDVQMGSSADVDGNNLPDECDGVASTHCSTTPNSTGPGASIGFGGSIRIGADDFRLLANKVPALQPGLFFFGPGSAHVPFGEGVRCVAGPITRLPVISSDVFGLATFVVDFTSPPAVSSLGAGVPTTFQYWYRDPVGGGSAFNLSHALTVSFVP